MQRPQSAARHGGFTLVSALMTVAILGITMVIAGPALWEITYEIKLKNAARETISAMRAARYRAINEVRQFGVLARLPNKIQVFEGNDPLDAAAVRQEIVLPGGVSIEGPSDAVPVGATWGFDTNAAGGFVIFGADGSADNAGGIRLGNANGHFIEVTLEPETTARMQLRTWDQDATDWKENG